MVLGSWGIGSWLWALGFRLGLYAIVVKDRGTAQRVPPNRDHAVAGIRAAFARADGDPARRYTATPAAMSAMKALP